MKDIPIFTSPHGIATLLLRGIPGRGCAYVVIHSALSGRITELLAECRRFCMLAGARSILATADDPLPLPHAYDLLELSCSRTQLPPPSPPVTLRPVTAENAKTYLQLYETIFRTVPGAAVCTASDLAQILNQEFPYLAEIDGDVAGIGLHTDSELRAVGILPAYRGLGRRLTLTLLSQMTAETVTLQVSSTNAPALRLYEKLGFSHSRVLSRWHTLTAE